MHRRTLIAAGLAAPFAQARAQAAWAPNRPIRFIVPFVAGGSTDVAARIIADRMGETLGQPVIVENRGGSGGNIGGDIVAKAPPDGHTILMGVTGLLATNKHIYRQMAFDPDRDLAPVSMAYVTSGHQAPGTTLWGEVRGKRLPATVTALPFRPATYKRRDRT